MVSPTLVKRPPGTIPYADDVRYKGGFGVPSDSNPDKIYKVSYDSAGGYWVCSCPAGIFKGACKHMDRYGRDGRATLERLVVQRKPLPPTPKFEPAPANAQPLVLPKSMAAAPIRRFARADDV